MDYYIDIQIQPDAEMRENELLNKVYTKFHKALFDMQANDVGVSFPEYYIKLGRTLRIHATKNRLSQLQQLNWVGGLSGYCKFSAIQAIPDKVMYRTVSRIQTTMSSAKFQRLIKRGTIAESDNKQYRAKMFEQGLNNAFLEIESTSNGHKHRRYLEFGELTATPISGQFNQFGLSKMATVPWF
jgi:CRISPR-associated endonuclease Csy4